MILSLFGTVSGFQSLVFGKPPTGLTDQWIDYRNELPLQSGDWALVVRRKQVPEGLATWIGLYRHTNEMGASRGGVYGAGAWLINQWIPGDLIVSLLWAHADEMARIGVEGGRFTRTLDEIEREFQWPQSLGAEVMRALEPWVNGGLGVGDMPTALLDLSQAKDSSAWDWALAALQCGPGVDSFDRAIVTNTIKVAHQVKAGARVTPLTPQLLMQLGSEAVAAAQQQVLEEHKRLLQVEQDRATLREKIQQEMEQRWEHKAAQQARQRESALALELDQLKSQSAWAQRELEAAEAEVSRLKFKLQQEVQERVSVARNLALEAQTTRWSEAAGHPEVAHDSYPSPAQHAARVDTESRRRLHWPSLRQRWVVVFSVLVGTTLGWWLRGDEAPAPTASVTVDKPYVKPTVVDACSTAMSETQATADAVMDLKVPLGRYEEAANMVWAISCARGRPSSCREAEVLQIERSLREHSYEDPKGMMTSLRVSLPVACRAPSGRDTWVLMGQGSTLLRQDTDMKPIERSSTAAQRGVQNQEGKAAKKAGKAASSAAVDPKVGPHAAPAPVRPGGGAASDGDAGTSE